MQRWLMVVAGTVLQLCLGTVYAWSYFQKPLVEHYGWTNAQVSWAFSLAICCLGLAAAWGGARLSRFGPRRLAVAGAVLFGGGYLAAAAALHWQSLVCLWLGYGVLGGVGLGLGYVTPVATVARWFPDRKGLATGIVIMGFGLGALLMSKVLAPLLLAACEGALTRVFLGLGVCLGGLALAAASVLRNPPATGPAAPRPAAVGDGGLRGVASRQFALLWGMFFANIAAGISIISFQSPLLQDLWQAAYPVGDYDTAMLAGYGATLIAVSSIFNGLGRMFWAGLSDRWGQLAVFHVLLASQVVALVVLALTGSPWLFAALVCYVLLCYGGGFGTMPALVAHRYGPARMPLVYGCVLTAWSAAGVAGPQLVALLKDHCGAAAGRYAFGAAAGLLTVGLLLSLALRTTPTAVAGGAQDA